MFASILNPNIGTIFWMILAFTLVFLLLRSKAWSLIIKGIKDREDSIKSALESADSAREEMETLKLNNEKMIQQVKAERARMIEETNVLREKILAESEVKAKKEADKIVEAARRAIQAERLEAIKDLKKDIAVISVGIAEKILRGELENKEKQEELVSKLVDDVKLN